jgi:hypothetical protein
MASKKCACGVYVRSSTVRCRNCGYDFTDMTTVVPPRGFAIRRALIYLAIVFVLFLVKIAVYDH